MKPNFTKLKVWHKGVDLAVRIYKLTDSPRLSKDFGMKDQLQRSAVSIPANIAEGDELGSNKQANRHFKISKGSSGELYTLAEICKRANLMDTNNANAVQNECLHISGMLGNLIKARK